MNREEGRLAVVNHPTTGRSTQVMGKGVSLIAQGGGDPRLNAGSGPGKEFYIQVF